MSSSSCRSVFTLCHPNRVNSCSWQLSSTRNSGRWSVSGNTIARRRVLTRKDGSEISSTFSSITSWSAHARGRDSICVYDDRRSILRRTSSNILFHLEVFEMTSHVWVKVEEEEILEMVGMRRQTAGWFPDASCCGLRWNTSFYRLGRWRHVRMAERRGAEKKRKRTRSPLESCLRFFSFFFPTFNSSESTRLSSALLFFLSLPLFRLLLPTFNSPSVLAQSSSLSLLPASYPVPICWPCQSRLISTPEGEAVVPLWAT